MQRGYDEQKYCYFLQSTVPQVVKAQRPKVAESSFHSVKMFGPIPTAIYHSAILSYVSVLITPPYTNVRRLANNYLPQTLVIRHFVLRETSEGQNVNAFFGVSLRFIKYSYLKQNRPQSKLGPNKVEHNFNKG